MTIERLERSCPADERLAAWSEGRGDAEERETIARHVAGCGACADVVAAVLPSAHDDADLAPAARSMARARRRRWALAAGVLLTTAALAYGALAVAAARARDALARRAAVALQQPVTIGRAGVGFADRFTALELGLHDVRIGDTDTFSADDITVRIPLASMIAGAPVVSRVRLVGPVISLGHAAPGTPLRVRTGGAEAVAGALHATAAEIVDGTVILQTAGATPLRFEHVAGTITPTDGRLAIALTGAAAGGTVSAEGELATDRAAPLSVTLGGRGLAANALPYAAGRLDGGVDLLLHLTGTARAPTVAGRLLVRAGRARGWNPLPAVLVTSAAAAAVAAARPSLTGDDLAFDELRVAFVAAPDGWRVPRLFVTAPGLVAGAILRVGDDGRLDGTGTAQLDASVAAALLHETPGLAPFRGADGTVTVPLAIAGSLAAPAFTVATNAGPVPTRAVP